jgi:transposase-like protein
MKAYSLDLRQKVLAAALRGDRTVAQVTESFGISTTFVDKVLSLHRAGEDHAPRPHGGYPARLLPRHEKAVARSSPAAEGCHPRIAARLSRRAGQLGGWRFYSLAGADPARPSGSGVNNTALIRRSGRVPRGVRLYDSTPRNYGSHTFVIGAMGL